MKISSLVLAAALGWSLAHQAAYAQRDKAPQDKSLTGTLTIRTNRSTTAVHGKTGDKKQDEFMFCIDQDPATAQKLYFDGPGRVVYRPMLESQHPAGVVVTGPERVAPTLAVVTEDGQNWLFLGKGQKPILPAGDPALAKATTVNVTVLRRTDWASRGFRRGTDITGCIAPGG